MADYDHRIVIVREVFRCRTVRFFVAIDRNDYHWLEHDTIVEGEFPCRIYVVVGVANAKYRLLRAEEFEHVVESYDFAVVVVRLMDRYFDDTLVRNY